jgi:hypothetical protein
MKKILTLATAALLFTGAAFAHPGGKECCKKGGKEGKECCKKGGANKASTTKATTTKAPSKKA